MIAREQVCLTDKVYNVCTFTVKTISLKSKTHAIVQVYDDKLLIVMKKNFDTITFLRMSII